jgi:hypothetical protein
MEVREILQEIQRQCLIISGNIYDMTKELEAMNEKASELKRKITETLNKTEFEE